MIDWEGVFFPAQRTWGTKTKVIHKTNFILTICAPDTDISYLLNISGNPNLCGHLWIATGDGRTYRHLF